MTTKRSLRIKIRILSAFTLFLALLTVLIAFAAPAQQANADQTAKLRVVAVPPHATGGTQEKKDVRLSGARETSRVGGRQNERLAASGVDSSALDFLPAIAYDSGGIFAQSVTVADVNEDGKPDLIVANQGGLSGSVGVLLGNGDGTFQAVVTYNSGDANTLAVAVADVNGDGKPDLVVANVGTIAGSTVGVLLGNGDGTFQTAVTYASGGDYAFSVAVADVNEDGRPDLVVANCSLGCFTTGVVSVLLGNGNGTFQKAVSFDSGGSGAVSVAVADVNGDGKPDVIVANSDGTVGVLLGNGNGTFQPAVTYGSGGSGGLSTGSLAVADVNGDGKPDLLVANVVSSLVGVLLGNGDGTFQAAVSYGSGGISADSVAVADVNRDGKPDLLVTNECVSLGVCGSRREASVGALLGNGDGTFQAAQTFGSGGAFADSIAVADVNGDGKLDLLVANACLSHSGSQCFGNGALGVLLNITRSLTSTSLVSSLNPSIYGQKVTWSATVTTSGPVPPTGIVNFSWSGYSIGTATLNSSGVATLTKSNLNVYTYPLIAVYKGDTSDLGSTSAIVNQVVKQATSAATLSSSPNPSTKGQAVTFTATITSPTVVPTGPVTFTAGKTVLGTAQLSGGRAKFTTSTLAVGSTTVTGTYYGDSNIAESSASVTQVVNQ
jgi:hypothetical protein